MTLSKLFFGHPWAIHPAKLEEIHIFVQKRLDGQVTLDLETLEKIEAGKSGPTFSEDEYEVEDGVAIIKVYGVIEQRMNMFSRISGGTSTEQIAKAFRMALEDPTISAIFLDIDSPGGGVSGTKELSDLIQSHKGDKPVMAFTDGMMASAAYWIGSAADQVVCSDTAMVGSIGVAMLHRDVSKRLADMGVTETPIFAGKYKRIASREKPLSEEGKEYLQSMVDTYYSLFVESVATNRGVSVEDALKMADGKDFIGKQAEKVGLVNFISTREAALEKLKERIQENMDYKTFQGKHPELFAQVLEEGRNMGAKAMEETLDKAIAESTAKGIDAERQRVVKILSSGGDPKIIAKLVEDGTPASEAFEQLFQAEKEKNAKLSTLAGMAEEAPHVVGAEAPPKPEAGPKKFEDLVADKQANEGMTYAAAVGAVVRDNPKAHQEYLARINTAKKEA
jgi:signal peptide peptidase SppA